MRRERQDRKSSPVVPVEPGPPVEPGVVAAEVEVWDWEGWLWGGRGGPAMEEPGKEPAALTTTFAWLTGMVTWAGGEVRLAPPPPPPP